MGNSESSSNHNAYVIPVKSADQPLAFELDEGTALKQLIDGIPPAYRDTIVHLPTKPLLDIHRHHLMAIYQLQRQQLTAASHNELQAINRLKSLLPNEKNHYLFMEMYCVLSECLLKLDEIPDALIASQNAVELLLEYSPTDFKELSIVYNRLGQCYKVQHAWEDAIHCLSQAVENMRQCKTPNEQNIASVQADIELIKKRISIETLMNQTDPNEGESEIEFQRRKRSIIDAFHAECGLLQYNLSETKRIPDKRTETQITEKILNDVSTALTSYLTEYVLEEFKTGCEKATFIAAAFKAGRMKGSYLSPSMIEAALTILTRRSSEYETLKNLPFELSFTDDSESLPAGVREFIITTKEGNHLNETTEPPYEMRDSFE